MSENPASVLAIALWQELKQGFLTTGLIQLSIVCPRLPESRVRGERRYTSEALLLLPDRYKEQCLSDLITRLDKYSESLAQVLDQNVLFNYAGTQTAILVD